MAIVSDQQKMLFDFAKHLAVLDIASLGFLGTLASRGLIDIHTQQARVAATLLFISLVCSFVSACFLVDLEQIATRFPRVSRLMIFLTTVVGVGGFSLGAINTWSALVESVPDKVMHIPADHAPKP
jgi:hypothetical protein